MICGFKYSGAVPIRTLLLTSTLLLITTRLFPPERSSDNLKLDYL